MSGRATLTMLVSMTSSRRRPPRDRDHHLRVPGRATAPRRARADSDRSRRGLGSGSCAGASRGGDARPKRRDAGLAVLCRRVGADVLSGEALRMTPKDHAGQQIGGDFRVGASADFRRRSGLLEPPGRGRRASLEDAMQHAAFVGPVAMDSPIRVRMRGRCSPSSSRSGGRRPPVRRAGFRARFGARRRRRPRKVRPRTAPAAVPCSQMRNRSPH